MFRSEIKGGPALRTAKTLQALSRIFEVSLLVWSEKQLEFEKENKFILSNPQFKKILFWY
jgi:hypothetical protein